MNVNSLQPQGRFERVIDNDAAYIGDARGGIFDIASDTA